MSDNIAIADASEALQIVTRNEYKSVMVRPTDQAAIEAIQRLYGVPRAEVIRHMLTRLLRIVDRQGEIPLPPVADIAVVMSQDTIDDDEQAFKLNVGPTIAQNKRLREVANDYDISMKYLVTLAIRLGVAAYRRGEFALQRAYVYNEKEERRESGLRI